MEVTQRIRRTLGTLMLAHLALGLIGPYVVLVPMTAPPGGFLLNAADMAISTRAAVIALIVGGALPILMTGAGRAVWQVHTPALGETLLAVAVANFSLQLVENSLWLGMLSVSEAYRTAGSDAVEAFRGIEVGLRALFRWNHYAHILVLVVWLLLLFVALWRSALLPRWLGAAGVATCVLHLATIPLPEFLGSPLPWAAFGGMPLALVVLVAAASLLIGGLRTALPRGSTSR